MRYLIYFITSLLLTQAKAEFVVPPTPHPVNDYAGVIDAGEKESIAEILVHLKESTGVQVGVLIVPSLDGTDIETASMKVAESWKLGSKKNDGGVLIMLAMAEHKSRIEIGRGLEGFLTDAQSKEILVDMRPYLKRGNVGAGLLMAVQTIATLSVTNKEDIMNKPEGVSSGAGNFFLLFLLILGAGIGVVMYLVNLGEKKRRQEAADRLAKIKNITPELQNDNIMRLNEMIRRGKTGGYGGGIPRRPVGRKSSRSTSSSRSSPTIVPVPIIIETPSSSYDSGSSSSSSDSGSSYSSSDYSGGGGDFSGGGSSDSW